MATVAKELQERLLPLIDAAIGAWSGATAAPPRSSTPKPVRSSSVALLTARGSTRNWPWWGAGVNCWPRPPPSAARRRPMRDARSTPGLQPRPPRGSIPA